MQRSPALLPHLVHTSPPPEEGRGVPEIRGGGLTPGAQLFSALAEFKRGWRLCAPGCFEPRRRGQGASGPASPAGCGASSSAKCPHAAPR
ncbi:Angiopoietin-Related Protein 7 [Manis pentadactyla]|nr:Angiopoietin-Related Protein 7 [Manis pentadactyla]